MAATFDSGLVEQALSMALLRRKPEAGLLHHSDRGCQYTSEAYQRFLKAHDIQVSMSRKGNCWDNAVMERDCWHTQTGMYVTRAFPDT